MVPSKMDLEQWTRRKRNDGEHMCSHRFSPRQMAWCTVFPAFCDQQLPLPYDRSCPLLSRFFDFYSNMETSTLLNQSSETSVTGSSAPNATFCVTAEPLPPSQLTVTEGECISSSSDNVNGKSTAEEQSASSGLREKLEFMYRKAFIIKQNQEKLIRESESDHLSKTIVEMVTDVLKASGEDPDFKMLEETLAASENEYTSELNAINDKLDFLETRLLGNVKLLEKLKERVIQTISSLPIEETFRI